MADKKKVIVKINGQEYTVMGEETEEYIKHIAGYVDEKAKEIYSKNNKFSQAMVSILAAFTITDEYYKNYQELVELKESIIEPLDELDKLRIESKENSEKIEKLKKDNNEMRAELIEVKKKDGTNVKKLKQYEQGLELKEEELEISQKIISKLQNKLFENQVELVQLRKELDELMKAYDKK